MKYSNFCQSAIVGKAQFRGLRANRFRPKSIEKPRVGMTVGFLAGFSAYVSRDYRVVVTDGRPVCNNSEMASGYTATWVLASVMPNAKVQKVFFRGGRREAAISADASPFCIQ